MSIIDIVKRNAKPIMGVVAGLGIAGASVYSALRGSNEAEDYDYEDENVEYLDFGDDDAEEEPSEETADDESE